MLIPIIPKSFAKVCTSVDLYATELRLDEYVVFCVSFFTLEQELLHREYVKIEGDEYNNWGSDDNYIKQIVLNRFDIQIA